MAASRALVRRFARLALPSRGESSRVQSTRIHVGGPSAVDLAKASWDASSHTPGYEIDQWLHNTFTSDPKSWGIGAEKLVVAQFIGCLAVVFTGGSGVIFFPLIMALAGAAVSVINDFLSNIFGRKSFCEHPELQPTTDAPLHPGEEGTWIHYPGRNGFGAIPQGQGWGKLGLDTVGMYLADYPQIQRLKAGVGPDLNRRALRIPDAPSGSFLSYWYVFYAHIKEINYFQQCMALSPSDADAQEETAFLGFVALWNRTRSNTSTMTYPGPAQAGDDLSLVAHRNDVVVNTGPLLPVPAPPRNVSGLHGAIQAIAGNDPVLLHAAFSQSPVSNLVAESSSDVQNARNALAAVASWLTYYKV